jgi:hypothetical protein
MIIQHVLFFPLKTPDAASLIPTVCATVVNTSLWLSKEAASESLISVISGMWSVVGKAWK